MSLKKALKLAVEPLKHEPVDFKKKVAAVYRVAEEAIKRIDELEKEIANLRAPRLDYSLDKPTLAEEKRYYSRVERIRHFLENDPDNPAFKLFLKHNRITMDQAIAMAKGEIK